AGTGAEDGAGDPQAPAQHLTEIDLDVRPAEEADEDEAALVAQSGQMAVDGAPTDQLDDEIDAAPAGRCPDLLRQVAPLDEDFINAQRAELLQPVAVAAGGQHAGAELTGELCSEAPDAAGGAGDQHRLPGLQATFDDQVGPGREAGFGDGRRLLPGEVFGDGHELAHRDGV